MLIKIFTLPIINSDEENIAMNKFLSTHKVIDIRDEIVDNKYWTFCVRYLDSANGANSTSKNDNVKGKPDYRELLSVDEFGRFAAMREIRKEIAAEKGVPPYAIFTDAELASLSREESLTIEIAKKIKGIGRGHMEYIEQIINRLSNISENEKIQ